MKRKGEMGVRCGCLNIHYGFGADGRLEPGRGVEAMRGCDIIALQEVTRGMPDNGGIDLAAIFRTAFPGHFFAEGMATDIDAGSTIEKGTAVERRFQFGNAVLSRYPILAIRNHLLPRRRTQLPVNLQRGALEVLIAVPGGPVRFICVHLDHAEPEERNVQIEALHAIIDGFCRHGGAITGLSAFGHPELPLDAGVILLGDFNLQPDSAEYARMVADGRLVDSSAGDPGHSFFNPAEEAGKQRLDYVLADPPTSGRISRFRFDRGCEASDHMPLYFTLS